MKLSGVFVFIVCALSGAAAAGDTTKNALPNALSMDTWYRIGVTQTPQNVVENAMDTVSTAPSTTKLVFNLRRH